MTCELFIDLKTRFIENLMAMGITRETAELVVSAYDTAERAIKRDYSGDRVHIGKRAEHDAAMSLRNRQIIRDWKAGERVPLIARRYGISRVRVWQIVKGL